MKGKLTGVLTVVLLALICAGAASAVDYGVTGGSISVNGAGVVTSAAANVTEVEIPAEINGIAVTAIGAGAFQNHDKLTRVVIPDGVTTIGAKAFYSCDALTDVTLPAGATMESEAFSWCRWVNHVLFTGTGDMADFTESYTCTPWYSGSYYQDHDVTVEIAAGVTSIGAHTFHGCGRLTKAVVADSVTKIGDSAFEGCSKLGDLYFVRYADEIGKAAFYNCGGVTGAVVVKDGVTVIPAQAFQGCSMKTLTLPDSVETIETKAFYSCAGLETVTLPAGATMESEAFSWSRWVKSVTLTGEGPMSDFTKSYTWTPWYSGCYYADHDMTLKVEKGVTSIGAHAFHGCGRLKEADVADSVKKIGDSAFEGCSALGDLYFVQYADEIGKAAFYNCGGVSGDVIVKDGVTVIPAQAFQGCSMQTLTLPDSVKTIETKAFYSCASLTDVTLPAGVTMESEAFSWCRWVNHVLLTGTGDMPDFTESYTWTPWYSGCYYADHDVTLEIASGVTSVGAHTFHGCGRIVKATVADTVSKIGASAFEGCSSLGDLDFVQYADEIGEAAFYNCGGVQGAVIVKDGVSVIPAQAFQGCSMKTLTLPDSVKAIETKAFYACAGLETVTLPAGAELKSEAFSWSRWVNHVLFAGEGPMSDFTESYTWTPWYSGCYYGDHDVTVEIASGVTSIGAHTFHGCGKLVKATVADTVKTIGESAFNGCSSLESLYFVRYADEIGKAAFYDCKGVKGSVVVKDGVSVIPAQAFQGCSLQTLTLPDSVKTIESRAFYSCSSLTDVTLPAGVTMQSEAFSWCRWVNHVLFTGTGDMSDFTDVYTWTPWYSGCYYADHDVTIDIAQGVTSIGANAFRGCGRMQSITIPVSVTRIDTNALYDCSALHVHYAGSESQWGGVTKTLSKKNPNTLGNTVLTMRYASAATLVVNAPDGKNVLSRTFSPPAETLVYVVGYDATGKMTEFQSKTGAETLIFALSDTRTANVRVLFFAANFAPIFAPIPAAV